MMDETQKQSTDGVEYVEDTTEDQPHVKDRTKRLQMQLEKCKKERAEYLEGWQRAKADVINARRDMAQRMASVHQRAGEDVLRDMLDVLDNLDAAIVHMPAEAGEWGKGVEQVRRHAEGALARWGVQRMETAVGDLFDPVRHEAVGRAPAGRDGTVVEVKRAGYLLHETVMRPASVIVAAEETGSRESAHAAGAQ